MKHTTTFALLFSLLLTLTSCGSDNADDNNSRQEETSTPSANAGRVSLWERSDGYDAAVFLPQDYGAIPGKLYPVIISLYGLGGSVLEDSHTEVGGQRSGFIKQVWDTPLAASFPAIVIAPEVGVAGPTEDTLWNHDELRDLIEDALDTYEIDDARVVVTGFSAGSIAAQELALRSKDLIAAVMPGAFEAVVKVNLCSVEDLPFWSFGNSDDTYFQPASWNGVQADIANCPNYKNTFSLTVYENNCGHDCWDQHWARGDVQRWLTSQRM